MDGLSAFLKMGGYAPFVWPAFGIAALVMIGFLVTSLRTMRARQATLRALEAATPARSKRKKANTT